MNVVNESGGDEGEDEFRRRQPSEMGIRDFEFEDSRRWCGGIIIGDGALATMSTFDNEVLGKDDPAMVAGISKAEAFLTSEAGCTPEGASGSSAGEACSVRKDTADCEKGVAVRVAKGETLSFSGLLPLVLYTESESGELGVEFCKSCGSKPCKSAKSEPQSSDSNESNES